MVVWNTADAEFDEKLGEIIVKSRHRLENGQILAIQNQGSTTKTPKIVGAVSILLIQPDIGPSNEPFIQLNPENNGVKSSTKEKVSGETADDPTDVIANKINLCIPASLSILPVPGCSNIYGSYANFGESKCFNEQSQKSADSRKENSDEVPNSDLNQEVSESKQQNHSVPENVETNQTEPNSVTVTSQNQPVDESYFQESEKVPNAALSNINDDKEESIQMDHSQNRHPETTSDRNIFSSLKDIENISHNNLDTKETDYSCLFCGKDIFTFEAIVQHALEDHRTPNDTHIIPCPLCDNKFNKLNMHEFLQHVRIHLKAKIQPKSEAEVEKIKGKTTVIDFSNVDLDNYTSKESSPHTPFFTGQNPNLASSAAVAEDSMLDGLYEEMPKGCEVLGNETTKKQRTSLIKPMSEGKLVCSECGQTVRGYRDIINHNKLHGKNNQCPICQKYFSMRGSLLRHCVSHTQNKVFPCHICTAVFTRKDNLKRHILKHEMFGPMIKKNNRPVSNLFINQSPFKVKEKKNKGLKMSLSLPKQEKFTSFKRQKSHYRKPFSQLIKNSKMLKNNFESHGGSENAKDSQFPVQQKMSTESDTHGENGRAFPIQEQCYTKTSEQNTDSNTSMYLVDSAVHLFSNTDDTDHPVGNSEIQTTAQSILNYSCSMCGVSFKKLASLKRHVIMTHSEQSPGESEFQQTIPQTTLPVHHNQSLPQDMTEMDHTTNTYPQAQKGYFYNDHHKDNSNHTIGYRSVSVNQSNFNDAQKNPNTQMKLLPQVNVKRELEETDVIDIESLSHLPQFTPDEKEETNGSQHSSCFSSQQSSSFSASYGGGGEFVSQSATDNQMNMALQSSFAHFSPQSFPSSGYPQEIDLAQAPPPVIKIPTLQGRTNQNRRHRMLNSKLPICHFCGIYLETGSQIVKHGDEHQDQFANSCTCTICLQVLCGRDSLHRHAHSHIGTSFDCEYCNASFSRKDNLKRHLKKVHNAETTPSRNTISGTTINIHDT